jgi:hypothetical protein
MAKRPQWFVFRVEYELPDGQRFYNSRIAISEDDVREHWNQPNRRLISITLYGTANPDVDPVPDQDELPF